MINVRKLKEVLETSLNDGIDGICLISTDGSLLCSAELNVEIKNTLLAAITSSIYSSSLQSIQNHNQQQQQQDISFNIISFENGIIAIAPAGKNYLIAAYGREVATGLLRGRLLTLSQYFAKVFEQTS